METPFIIVELYLQSREKLIFTEVVMKGKGEVTL